MATQIIENKGLTELAKKNLERNEELRRSMGSDGKYVSMAPGEQRVFFFDAEKMQPVELDNKWKPGTKVTRFQYTVLDPNTNKEQVFTLSGQWSEQIDALLVAGDSPRRLIKMKRIGEGKSTAYDIEAA